MNLTEQQGKAIAEVTNWLKHLSKKKQIFRLFGYAGTGKTTIAKYLADNTETKVVYAAFTGKAALMMAKKGCRGASTIHSLIYKTEEKADGSVKFIINKNSPIKYSDIVVIDECSMVNEELAKDIMSFRKPILVIGDPAQLAPVKGTGFFTNAEPDFLLTEIHRQAKDNPVLYLATRVREGMSIDVGTYGESRVASIGKVTESDIIQADQILVGKNNTRISLNKFVRAHKGFPGVFPLKGDKLVCLRNDNTMGIFNGGIFNVSADSMPARSKKGCTLIPVTSEDFPNRPAISVKVRDEFFNGDPNTVDWRILKDTQQFDYGYALTTHKSQGSQWENVMIFDESNVFREQSREWLYTALTRASEKVTLVR